MSTFSLFQFCSSQLYQMVYSYVGWVVEAIRKITSHASRNREREPSKSNMAVSRRTLTSPDGRCLCPAIQCTVHAVTQHLLISAMSSLDCRYTDVKHWSHTIGELAWDWRVVCRSYKPESWSKWHVVGVKKISQNSWSPYQDSNPRPLEYEILLNKLPTSYTGSF